MRRPPDVDLLLSMQSKKALIGITITSKAQEEANNNKSFTKIALGVNRIFSRVVLGFYSNETRILSGITKISTMK